MWWGPGHLRVGSASVEIGNDPNCPKGEPAIGWNNTSNRIISSFCFTILVILIFFGCYIYSYKYLEVEIIKKNYKVVFIL